MKDETGVAGTLVPVSPVFPKTPILDW